MNLSGKVLALLLAAGVTIGAVSWTGQDKLTEMNTEVGNLVESKGQLGDTIGELKTALKNLHDRSDIKDSGLQTKIQDLLNRINEIQGQISQKDIRIGELEGQVKGLLGNIQTLEGTIKDLQASNTTITNEANSLRQQLNTTLATLKVANERITTLTEDLRVMTENRDRLQRELDAAKGEANDNSTLVNEIKRLNGELTKANQAVIDAFSIFEGHLNNERNIDAEATQQDVTNWINQYGTHPADKTKSFTGTIPYKANLNSYNMINKTIDNIVVDGQHRETDGGVFQIRLKDTETSAIYVVELTVNGENRPVTGGVNPGNVMSSNYNEFGYGARWTSVKFKLVAGETGTLKLYKAKRDGANYIKINTYADETYTLTAN